MINGNNIIVFRQSGSDWIPLAATRSDELTVDSEVIEISDGSVQDWKRFIAGRKSWSLNTSFLVGQVDDIRKALDAGTRVRLHIGDRSFSGSTGLEGFAIVRMAKITMTRGNLSNGTFSFVGDGSLE